MKSGAFDRYRKLAIEDSLTTRHYSSACKELALILKLSYPKFPKSLQSIVIQDVLTAFRLLPKMQTQTAVSAANTLLQSVESTLPKQKKALAVTEFKHAMVAHKRYSKARHNNEQDFVELPQDILVHIFSFLDLQSLVSASEVCRSWNVASSDNRLWQLVCNMVFNTFYKLSKINKLYGELTLDENPETSQQSNNCSNNLDWRTVFKKTYNGCSLKEMFKSSRGFCKHCHAIVWSSDIRNESNSGLKCKYHQIKPISTRRIAEYINGDYASSDSNSDSDSSDEFTSKLWAYPKSHVSS
ncbi:F-box protein At5g52880 [Rutidosis leptorrhynchoides]|uniref:F-box protein At5g52880 n=1 Tax=Rutidosis leptorrhynchoides TaxID=125765 RepID=UPI003A990E7B